MAASQPSELERIKQNFLIKKLGLKDDAKLDEAKEGPVLQQVDVALPPDRKSKPSRANIVLASTLAALLAACVFVVWRRYAALSRELDPQGALAWSAMAKAWRFKR